VSNTLIFVDFPVSDPATAADLYTEVFGRVVEPRPADGVYPIVPGGQFPLDDGSPSLVGKLHTGIYDPANARPHPDPAGVEPRQTSASGRMARTWNLVGDDDEDRIMDTAVERGATELWGHHYWAEFNGFSSALLDPWGNPFVLWTRAATTRRSRPATRANDAAHPAPRDRGRPGRPGTMMFGAWGDPDEAECRRMVYAALDAGVTLFEPPTSTTTGGRSGSSARCSAASGTASCQGRQPDGR
jgi:Glyoxalase-like domain